MQENFEFSFLSPQLDLSRFEPKSECAKRGVEMQIFFLQLRGIGEVSARRCQAFFSRSRSSEIESEAQVDRSQTTS
jgi:hypothetical protein